MKTIYKICGCLLGFLSLTAQASGSFSMPEYDKVKLANGVTVYLMEQKEVPLIDVNIVVEAGATLDGTSAGLASMTADNLLFGTKKLDKKQFENTLEFVGANFNTSANLDYTQITASFAKKDQADMMPLLADVVMSPRFDNEEFDKYKQRYLGSLKRQKESPRNVIADYYNQLIYEDHPYSASIGGDENSVDAATIDDLKTFYANNYSPKNTAIVVVGDFEIATMREQIKTIFGTWQTEVEPQQVSFPKLKAFEESRVLLVNKGDARESTFFIGGRGIPRSNEDFVAISVVNTILGGRFTSWLNDELRVNSGLTYGARSRFPALKAAGSFYIYTFTATETTEETIDLALETYSRLWKQGIDEETLKSAKAYVKGQFPPRYETSTELASLLGQMHVYGFNESFINDFQSNVDKLNVESTKKLIAKYFPQENLQMAIVGKAEDIKDIVKKYGKVINVEITEPGFAFK